MKRLRAERFRRGLSQVQLAAASGIKQTTISAIERGRINPTDKELSRLARVLDVSNPAELMQEARLLTAVEPPQ